MNSHWDALLPVAMAGTDHHAEPLPPLPGEIGDVVRDVLNVESNPATALLRNAAVMAVCGTAGASGSAWAGTLPAPAPTAESLSVLPPGRLRYLLRQVFDYRHVPQL